MHGKQGLHTSSCEAATVPIYMLCTVPLPYSTLLKSLLRAEALTLECLHGCFAQHNPLLPAIHSAGTTLKYQAYQGTRDWAIGMPCKPIFLLMCYCGRVPTLVERGPLLT